MITARITNFEMITQCIIDFPGVDCCVCLCKYVQLIDRCYSLFQKPKEPTPEPEPAPVIKMMLYKCTNIFTTFEIFLIRFALIRKNQSLLEMHFLDER